MDWTALWLSLHLAVWTVALLLPVSIFGSWALARARFRGKGLVEALITLPLVLPPTVIGFYLLVSFGAGSWLGQAWTAVFGQGLVFSFEGLVLASVIVNLPFAIQPAQRAFEAVPVALSEAAACTGLSPLAALWRVHLPLAWPGVLTGAVLTFAHTLGEFGVVLMVGGSIPGETKTLAVSIYDRVQAFDDKGAGQMALLLVVISVVTILATAALSRRVSGGWRA